MECQSCKNEGVEDHGCPFSEEIRDDYDTMCNCCSECQYECAQDI